MSTSPSLESLDAPQRLLHAAEQAFAVHGYHGTSTREIATRAGLSPAALYVHYATKEELLYELTLAGHTDALRVVTDAASCSTDPVEQLVRIAEQHTAWHARDHQRARLLQYEIGALTPEHAARLRRIRRRISNQVREVITRGVEAGVFRVRDIKMATTAILSLGIDVARWYRDDKSWTPEEIGKQYGEFALAIVGFTGSSQQAQPSGR